jgi:hypothetical protein
LWQTCISVSLHNTNIPCTKQYVFNKMLVFKKFSWLLKYKPQYQYCKQNNVKNCHHNAHDI